MSDHSERSGFSLDRIPDCVQYRIMSSAQVPLLSPFLNEPFTDFADLGNAELIEAALAQVSGELGHRYPSDLPLHPAAPSDEIVSVNPARPSQVIGIHACAHATDANTAVESAAAAWTEWQHRPMRERASLLFWAAERLRKRKMEFSAWLVFEVGKNWAEADADTAETIDFLEYYAREALALASAEPSIQYPGEWNKLSYLPLGVGAVLPPWNFPLAIMAGMTCAAIVAGNTVVLKPSPLAPTIAKKFHTLLRDCGLPEHVVTLAQGGPEFGEALVNHPKISFIAFTGSKKVGLHIHERAAKIQPGQSVIKRTILELGGKDAIIVEPDADLESAATAVVASAFGFNGQKCSACSRVIVSEEIYEPFVLRLQQKTAQLSQGDPAENFAVGPVINDAAYDRVLRAISEARKRGTIVAGGRAQTASSDGYYIQPTIVSDLSPDDSICQQEVFGPLLAVLKAKDFDEALKIANGTEYGLTGSVFSRSEEKLLRAEREFHVGNLYLNRKCTGAMVGAHPFGGFKMSGTDSKAGGSDYLRLFTQAKSIGRVQD
jgi:1-pyrroline-5-carboxylate dehydrogenase